VITSPKVEKESIGNFLNKYRRGREQPRLEIRPNGCEVGYDDGKRETDFEPSEMTMAFCAFDGDGDVDFK
jgi:hypothetical protein